MRYLIPLLCFLFTACGNGLETREETDENLGFRNVYTVHPETGRKQGEFRQYDQDDNLVELAHFQDDVLVGQRVLFSPQGDTLVVENYLDFNSEEGRRSATDEGLANVAASEAVAGLGPTRVEKLSGPYRTFHQDEYSNKVKQQGQFQDGAMSGDWKRFYPNGQIAEIVTFVDNQENGPFEEWYENGNRKATGNYLNGDYEHGKITIFAEDGSLEKILECDHGACQTLWRVTDGTLPPATE